MFVDVIVSQLMPERESGTRGVRILNPIEVRIDVELPILVLKQAVERVGVPAEAEG
jgi:hypothetical protein